MTGGFARPRVTRAHGPSRLGSIPARVVRCRWEGTGLVDPAHHPDPTSATAVASIGAARVGPRRSLGAKPIDHATMATRNRLTKEGDRDIHAQAFKVGMRAPDEA